MKRLLAFVLCLALMMTLFPSMPIMAESETMTVIHSCDSTDNIAVSTVGTWFDLQTAVKTQGIASVWFGLANHSLGAAPCDILYMNITAQNFSSYDAFAIDVYVPGGSNNQGNLQIDFINSQSDAAGVSVMRTLSRSGAGWISLQIDKAEIIVPATGGNIKNNIGRLRFVWYNTAGISSSTMNGMCIDNIRGIKRNASSTATTPSISGGAGTISTCETTDGWQDAMFNTEVGKSNVIKRSGSNSIIMKSTIPVGQSSNVGAMTKLTFASSIDLSSSCSFTFYMYFDQATPQYSLFQFNFITNKSMDDGFNIIKSFNTTQYAAGTWHAFTVYKKDAQTISATGADWSKINAIRITWFNQGQSNTYLTTYIDDITATAHSSTNGGTSGVHKKCKNCSTTLSTSHSYTKTTQTAATCTTKGTTMYTCSCGYSYTSQDIPINPSNHAGDTEVRNASETYSGDIYCLDCDALIQSGKQIDTNSVNGYVVVSNAIGYQDDEVTITVSLGKNTAVAAYSATLVYDETALQLVSMTKGDFCTSVNVNNGIAVGFDSYNVTSGTLFSATFKILAKEGDYEVGVTFDDACLEDQTTVNMNVIPGIISIQCAHEDLSEIKYDEANHWYECETIGCGNLVNVAPHEGGTATCTSKATCSVCGYAYGSVNTANHTGGTEVRGYIAADCGNAGYTGDTYCNGCGVKTKTGSTIPATGAHTGGQATCCSKAKCSVCGNIYGAIIANNHAGGTEVRNASETYTGDTYCLGCGVIIAKGNTIKTNDDIVEMTVGTINGVISAGEEIAIPVNISKWANAYAILELKFDYDETLLKLNSINQSEFNGFSSASNIDTGMFSLVCNPSNEEKANKLLGGEVCVAYFTATKDITVSTPIRVTANVSGYANGKNDNWTETKKLNVSIKNGGIHIEYFNVEGYTSDLIVPFDYPTNSYTNYTSEANSYISIENSEKTEGDGSLYWKFGKPTGQSSNVAGTVFYNTSMPMNLSIYNRFCFDIYIPKSMDGSGGILQVNFISDLAGQEGYNYFTSIADLNAGWNTITFTKASWNDHLSNADFSSIYRIRLVWINASQINREFFLLDNFRGIIDNTSSSDTTTNIGHTPYTTENGDLMINNADSLDGWNSKGRFNTSLEMGAQHIEGFGSVSMESIIPKDQVQNIGAMTMLTFPTTDLSSYDKFRFKVHLSHNLTDVHQFQVNFISGNSDDGFNHVFTFANFAAGWVEFIIDRESIPMAVDADWTSIHSIRFTWFNHSQISTQVSFTIDEIMAIDDASHECSNTGVIYPDVTDHWYFCKTFGCDSRLERAPHEGGEATCCEKAICDVCDAEYGDFDTTNHVGGTEIRDYNAGNCGVAGYTGDTYCLDCDAKIADGEVIPATDNHIGGEATCIAKAICDVCGQEYGSFDLNNHKNTELRDYNVGNCGVAGYTGDTYCLDCGRMIQEGEVIPATDNHIGGEATCIAKAICDVCGQEYGDENTSNHTGSSIYGGTNGVHTKYSCCGATISTTHTYDRDSGVQYSAATCTAKRKNYKSCVCGYNPKSTSYLVETGPALGHSKASSYSTDGTNHWYECTVCGADLNKAAHTASSTYSYNGTNHWKECTVCGADLDKTTHTASSTYSSNGTKHWKDCTVCGYYTNSAYCSGGTATCTARATCSTCKHAYGSVNSSNHNKASSYSTDETNHWKECTRCGADLDKAAHTASSSYSTNEFHHWNDCSTCGENLNQAEHSFTPSISVAATCTKRGETKYTCSCGHYYIVQNIEALGHTEVIDATVDPTCTETGLTEGSHCGRCGEILVAQKEVATLSHTGGEATCCAKAVCDVCGQEYGDVDATNHKDTVIINATKEDCGNDGYTGDTFCNDCQTVIANGQVIPATGAHVGGEATCCKKAVCDVCGQEYGEIDATNHNDTVIINATKEDCGNDGYTGDTFCNDCQTVVETGSVIPATGAHVGGEATCCKKAVCDVCSKEYGDVDANNHKNTEIRNASIVYSGDTWCLDCGNFVVAGEQIAVYGDANNDSEADIVDAMLIAHYDAGYDVVINLDLADVNGDGEVTILDAMYIAQFDAGVLESLPVE